MKRFLLLFFCLAAAAAGHAQGTRLWTQSTYTDLQKGTAEGVAIRSDGRLEAAPAATLVTTLASTYAWSLASDQHGNAYLGTGSVTGSPATLLRVGADGKAVKLAEFKEMAVQALVATPSGAIYAATSPDGKVYRVASGGGLDSKPAQIFDSAQTAEKPKYIWALALDPSTQSLYIATGAPAAIYRVNTSQPAIAPELFFKSEDQHIRSLLLAADGTLYAGSDGNGVIYRIARDGKSFALYSAPKREVTALALDSAGNLYAAAVGGKASPNLPPLPIQGNASATATITYLNAGPGNAASSNPLLPDGSDVYRIDPDGTPQKLVTLRDDVAYALTVSEGKLLAATGNKGHIYSIDTAEPGRFIDIAHLDANQAIAFAAAAVNSNNGPGLFIATSNTGKLWLLGGKTAPDATYTSQVFDAGAFSQWGRMEVRAEDPSAIDLYARSGNVENPKGAWSDWRKVNENGGWNNGAPLDIPAARYAQWKAVFHHERASGHQAAAGGKVSAAPTPSLESVSLNYLARNLPPVVDEVVVQTGARVIAANLATANNNVNISFAAPPQNNLFSFQQPDASVVPLAAVKDKTAVTARWQAHDDNGDDLIFSLYYRGDGEQNWQLLKARITERYYSFDSARLPDGGYLLKVVASDAPSHTPGDALTGERASEHFVLDTTPPVLSALNATLQGAAIHASLDARDATSTISHAEYSVDAGPWHYLEPAGKISDSLSEHYDFTAAVPPLPPDAAKPVNPNEHVIAVRVYDLYENMAAVKAMIH